MRLTLIDDESVFAAMAEVWDALLARSAQHNVFLTHSWLHCWWSVYGGGCRLQIAAVYDGSNRLLGLLPCYSGPLQFLGVMPFGRGLFLLGGHSAGADFLDTIVDPEVEEDVIQMLRRFLQDSSCLFDVISFSGLDENSLINRRLRSCLGTAMVREDEPVEFCPFVILPHDRHGFASTLSKKQREKTAYYRRALERKGEVKCETIENVNDIDGAIDDIMAMRSSRLASKGIATDFIDDNYRDFHKRSCHRILRDGHLRLTFLTVDGERLAFAYQYDYMGKRFFYQTGFDRKWIKQSVGFVLLGYEIEDAVNRGYTTFEFLRGNEPYKYEWGNVSERRLKAFKLYTRGFTGAAHYCFDSAYMVARNTAKSILQGTGLMKKKSVR